MRSWFGLIALVSFVAGMSLCFWTWHDKGTLPTWVVFYGYQVMFGMASVAGIASLFRRERWSAGSSFVLGLALASWFWLAAMTYAIQHIKITFGS